jgi:tartrate-resistant acid phosphatase type 5
VRDINPLLLSEFADFFFVDTTPFQLKYWKHPGKDHYDWRGVAPRGKYIANLLKVHFWKEALSMLQKLREKTSFVDSGMQDLDDALNKSTASWKIVIGHHTMRSVSEHGDTKELLKLLLPVLKVIQKWPQLFSAFKSSVKKLFF